MSIPDLQCHEAADEIERLRPLENEAREELNRLNIENERLRELAYAPDGKEMRRALFEEAEWCERLREALQKFVDHYSHGINPFLDEAYSMAREALAGRDNPT